MDCEELEELELDDVEFIPINCCGFDLIVTKFMEFLMDVGEIMLDVPLSGDATICVELSDDEEDETELSERSDVDEFECASNV